MVDLKDRGSQRDALMQYLDHNLCVNSSWYSQLDGYSRNLLVSALHTLPDLLLCDFRQSNGTNQILESARQLGLDLGQASIKARIPLNQVAEVLIVIRKSLNMEKSSRDCDLSFLTQSVCCNIEVFDAAVLGLAAAYAENETEIERVKWSMAF